MKLLSLSELQTLAKLNKEIDKKIEEDPAFDEKMHIYKSNFFKEI